MKRPSTREMPKHPMSYYRSVVTDAAQIPDAALRALFLELLDRLGLQVVQEETPDYCVFELNLKAGRSMKTHIPFFRHTLGWWWEGNGHTLVIEIWRLRIRAHIQPNW